MAILCTILEPFGRSADDVAVHREGTGLGLAIVNSLVQLHGGRLDLQSARGQGTTARLVFPASRSVEPAKTNKPAVSA